MAMLRSIYDNGITIYRRTLKRSGFLHAVLYKLMTKAVIPILERIYGFYTRDDDPLFFRLELILGSYEKETADLLRQFIRPGMTVIDVGAHIDYYTRLFSKLMNDTGRVIAFEPHPKTFEILRKNTSKLTNVMLAQCAVAEGSGKATLYDALTNTGGAALHYPEAHVAWEQERLGKSEISPRVLMGFPASTFEVDTVSLDDYLQQSNTHNVDVIKLDIEGAEVSALKGMKKLIETTDHLVLTMEFHPHVLQASGNDPWETLLLLREQGFQEIIAVELEINILQDETLTKQLIAQLAQDMKKVNLVCRKGHTV